MMKYAVLITDTFVSCRHSGKEDNKKRCRVFSSIGKVWELLLGVVVPAQTLSKAPPGRKTSEKRPQSVKLTTTLITIYGKKKR